MSNLAALVPARVEKGRLLWKDPILLSRVLSTLNGKDVGIAIKPESKGATARQRRYYFGVIIKILCEFTGYSALEMHEILKAMFLSDEKEIGGVVVRYSRSTEELSTIEKEEYHTNIREWASTDLGIYIPLPNEVSF
jgi:hypothetical protein